MATLLGLRDAGHRVINLAVSLGSDPSERERRRAEVEGIISMRDIIHVWRPR